MITKHFLITERREDRPALPVSHEAGVKVSSALSLFMSVWQEAQQGGRRRPDAVFVGDVGAGKQTQVGTHSSHTSCTKSVLHFHVRVSVCKNHWRADIFSGALTNADQVISASNYSRCSIYLFFEIR